MHQKKLDAYDPLNRPTQGQLRSLYIRLPEEVKKALAERADAKKVSMNTMALHAIIEMLKK